MRNFLLCFLCLSFAISAFGQQSTPTPTLYSEKTIEDLKRIQQAALQSDYAYKQTAYLSN